MGSWNIWDIVSLSESIAVIVACSALTVYIVFEIVERRAR